MEFDPEKYAKLMAKPSWKMIVPKALMLVGGIVAIVGLAFNHSIGFPWYFIPMGIGLAILVAGLIMELVFKKGSKPKKEKTVKYKESKPKVVKAQPYEEDKTKVICRCPACSRKIRLPNSKGKHGVQCPTCKVKFIVKIK